MYKFHGQLSPILSLCQLCMRIVVKTFFSPLCWNPLKDPLWEPLAKSNNPTWADRVFTFVTFCFHETWMTFGSRHKIDCITFRKLVRVRKLTLTFFKTARWHPCYFLRMYWILDLVCNGQEVMASTKCRVWHWLGLIELKGSVGPWRRYALNSVPF